MSVWSKARQAVSLPNLHFHDLRHTGGTLSAATGATLNELMARLGHSSVRAAMMYQHAALAAAGTLPSEAAVRRLVTVIMTGPRPRS